MDFEEYKLKEFKGDALALFIVSTIIAVDSKDRANQIRFAQNLTANTNFYRAAKSIGLQPHESEYKDPNGNFSNKAYANAYEVKLYEVYEEFGMEKAIEFFKDTAVKYYKGPIFDKFGMRKTHEDGGI